MDDETKMTGETAGEDLSDLLLRHLTTRESRNTIELEAISRAYDKHVFRSRKKKARNKWLTEEYLRQVHLDMFGGIWDWAGKYRQVDLNIGITWFQIPEQIGVLCEDFAFWNGSQSSMPTLEIAARLQNRLTRIHPFKNGNGRHARLITDIFLLSRDHPLPKWPQIQLMEHGDSVRRLYIDAMKQADKGNFDPLMTFIGKLL
jgi:Fic-DOC domain mobile mystery protein B